MLLMTTSQLNAQSIIIGTGTANTNGTGSDPIDDFYNGLHYQTVYTATELSNAGLTAGSSLTAIGFEVSEAPGTLANYTVALASTTQSDAATYINPGTTPFTTVIPAFSYVPLVQATGSFDMINFATNFIWDGTSNIVVDICTGPANPYSSPYGGVRVTTSTAGGSFSRADGSPASTVCTQPTGVAATGYSTGILATKPNVKFNYVAGTACSGTPFAGVASASAPVNNGGVCPNTTFTLSTTGSTSASGLTYDWQYNTGSGWFSTGVTTLSYVVTGGINVSTDYRLVVTCNSLPDISNVVPITVNTLLYCYCTPVSICVNEGIENVSFSTINNTSTFCLNPGGYTDYSNLGSLATVVQSQVVNMSVTAHINSSPASAGVWIDYDQSGTFDQAEYTSLGSVSVTIPSGGTTNIFSGNVTIDANALPGMTRMRVRTANQNGITNTSPCITTAAYGEFEDYLITINAGSICTGTPSAGTVTGPSAVCPNVNFTLNATGFTTGFTGFTYLWEVWNSATSTWDPAPGTNNGPTYVATGGIIAPTDYRFSITCTNGNFTSTTTTFPITINSFNQCYCIPAGASATRGINDFTTTGGSVNIANLGTGVSPAGYGNYTSQNLVAAPTDVIGFTAAYMPGTGTYGFAIFIDYNQNGLFSDPGEVVYNTTGYASSAAGSFTIPGTVTPGSTRMRIVANWSNSNPSGEYCSTSVQGEFEDYTLTIGAPPTCLAPTIAATTNVTTSSADINWNLSSSNPSQGYDYYYSNTNTAPTVNTTPTGSVGNTTTTVNLSNLNGSTTYYFWVRANCGGNDYSAWAAGSFMTLLSNDLPAGAVLITPGAGCVTFNNTGASFTAGEPPIACRGTNINIGAVVWFKFVAPLSGMAKVSTDGATTTLDTKLGVFTTSNPSNPADLTAYSILACDDDNGITYGTSSTVYVSDLTPGVTYYIAVDQYNGGSTGNFCVTVDDVTTAMISPAGACLQSTETPYSREDYTGWATIIDAQGRLIANARRLVPTGTNTVYQYTGRLNVNTGAVRQAGTDYYLDRNFSFAYGQTAPATTFDLRLYFLNTELAALQAVDPNATLSNLNVTHQTGTTCAANYTVAGGTNTVLLQSANGTGNSISWIQVNTPGFSNFYIMSGISPLKIDLESIRATNLGSSNRVDWSTASEQAGDRFEIERSTDGEHFIKLADLNAKGTPSTYSHMDERAVTGINYYRLKLVDLSGAFAYSDIVQASVKSGISFDVEVYPNPASDKVHVRVNGAKAGNASVLILDITGRVVRTVVMTGSDIDIDMARLPSGAYMVKYTDDSHSKTQKVTKQ